MAKKNGLGMGLDALYTDNESEPKPSETLRISEIEPNKAQPRQDFDDEAIIALADSIRRHGVLQPLMVRPLPNGTYQIVAGERRWRASRMVGLTEVPVVIRELSDKETMQIALIENLQRENLNPVEEALGYKDLLETYSMTQEEVAETVGKSRSQIANMLRILGLSDDVLAKLRREEISVGHAKVLVGIDDEDLQKQLAERVFKESLSVRTLEKLAKKADEIASAPSEPAERVPTYYKEVELALNETLGRKVRVVSKKGKRALEIEFYDENDLGELAKLLGNP